jgi:hypothetical protein
MTEVSAMVKQLLMGAAAIWLVTYAAVYGASTLIRAHTSFKPVSPAPEEPRSGSKSVPPMLPPPVHIVPIVCPLRQHDLLMTPFDKLVPLNMQILVDGSAESVEQHARIALGELRVASPPARSYPL